MRIARSLWLALTIGLVVGCGSGSSSGSSESQGTTTPPPAVQSAPEISGLNPTQVSATVTSGESTSASVSFNNSGDATLTYELTSSDSFVSVSNGSGSLGANDTGSVSVSLTCDSADESGVLSLVTNDADEGQLTIPVSVTCEAPASFEISRVVMNQGARVFDSDLDSAPAFDIVTGRDMLVRAFVTGIGLSPDADVVLVNNLGGEQRFAMQVPPTVSQVPADESLLSASHYAVLPASALAVGSSLRIEVSPQSNTTRYPASGNVDLGVVDPGDFAVTFVPVTFNGQTPIIDGDQYLRQTLQKLPVGDYNIDVRLPYVFTGSYDLDVLLDEITDLRNLDGSTRLYHAVIIPPTQGSQTAGLGYVGFPVSVSIDLGGSQDVISHEIGHNLNLRHAGGCDAPNSDPDFPYGDGDVNSWGYDVFSQQLVEPTPTRKDLMSYCSDLWISDYHFDKAMTHRALNPLGVSGRSGLLISGRIVNGEVVGLKLLPAPAEVQAASEDGDYTVIAYDRNGNVIGSNPMTAYEIGDSETDAVAFSVPLTGSIAEVHHVTIYRPDGVMLRHQFDTQHASMAQAGWQNGRRVVSWQPAGEETLIVRDVNGVVRSVDRTGRVDLSDIPQQVQLQLVRPGNVAVTSWVSPDGNERIQWSR